MTFANWLKIFFLIHKLSFRSLIVRKASWFGTLLFACCLLVMFSFSLGTPVLARNDVRIGSLWAIEEFMCALTIGRMFFAEQESFALDFLLAADVPRSAMFLGKVFFTALLIFSFQCCVGVFWVFLYNISFSDVCLLFPTLLAVSLFFAFGTAALGALICALTAKSVGREILQPLLFFPLQSGILLAATTLCMQSVQMSSTGAWSAQSWWAILFFYPILFSALGCLLSSVLLKES